MADKKGRVIAELASPTTPHGPDEPANARPKTCAACGLVHGSIGEHLACLSAEVRGQRLTIKGQRGIIGGRDLTIEDLRTETASLRRQLMAYDAPHGGKVNP